MGIFKLIMQARAELFAGVKFSCLQLHFPKILMFSQSNLFTGAIVGQSEGEREIRKKANKHNASNEICKNTLPQLSRWLLIKTLSLLCFLDYSSTRRHITGSIKAAF